MSLIDIFFFIISSSSDIDEKYFWDVWRRYDILAGGERVET